MSVWVPPGKGTLLGRQASFLTRPASILTTPSQFGKFQFKYKSVVGLVGADIPPFNK